MLDGLKSLQLMAKLQAELEKLSQNEENKKVLQVINELNEIKNKHDLNNEDFTAIIHTAYPKTKVIREVKTTKVMIEGEILDWPVSRKGALSGDLKALAKKHNVNTYKELLSKVQYMPSAET